MASQRLEATLDPLFIVLILGAFSTLGLLQTLTQNTVYPGLQLFVNIGALFSVLLLVLLVAQSIARGSPIIGPLTRPVNIGLNPPIWPEWTGRVVAAIVSVPGTYAGVILVNFIFTQGTFIPSVSFWDALTPKLFFGSGGIIETVVFDLVPVTAALLIVPRLVENRPLYFLVFLPILCYIAVLWHGYAYPNSPKALSIVFGEFYSFGAGYRFSHLLAWVAAIAHAMADIFGSP